MRMAPWFASLRRRLRSVKWAKTRRNASSGTRRQAPAFVESLEDRCLLAAGNLDPTFGAGGLVTTGFEARSVAIQSDGKIVVAGTTTFDGKDAFTLERFNSDGTLDSSFDEDGKLITSFGTSRAVAASMALQADGKIVVVGYAIDGSNYDFALARYNSDGSLDTSFDEDGKLTTDFGTPNDYANSVVIQGDGKIVVAGLVSGGCIPGFVVLIAVGKRQ
ncbi:MAG: delta-60 repeat domain-containing protein [Planctomycetaceae bacterium]